MTGLIGERLDGKYLIDRPLGQGGMGSVYRATHLGTTRTVAIKIIRPELSSDAAFVERFRREAESLGRLRHPNIVDITDFGFARGPSGEVAYLVMEYLDGCSLADVLEEEQRLSIAWVIDILEQVSSAVDEAHKHGVVHRDLKPENIWLEPNRRGGYTVKVLDFGLATAAGTSLVELGGSWSRRPRRPARRSARRSTCRRSSAGGSRSMRAPTFTALASSPIGCWPAERLSSASRSRSSSSIGPASRRRSSTRRSGSQRS
ncbi:MAG TPA: serine/threonine-protein kinase [Vicinamibacterales bacterium]